MGWPQSDITNDARIGGAPDGIYEDGWDRPLAAELPRFRGMGEGGGERRAGGGVRELPRFIFPPPSKSLPVGRREEREMYGTPEGPGRLEGAYSESKARSVCMACLRSFTRLAARGPLLSPGGWPVGVRGPVEVESEEAGEVGLGVRLTESVAGARGGSPKGPRATASNLSSSC